MSRTTLAALAVFGCAVLAGTLASGPPPAGWRPAGILTADLHVHAYPGDGALTIRQLRREAARRGIDVMAIAGHNNRFALQIDALLGAADAGTIVLPGQELTAPDFHLVAAGTERLIDWRLSPAEAIRAIADDGGVAIAAHPARGYDNAFDSTALRLLDGTEVAHPLRIRSSTGAAELDAFFDRARQVNPAVAPIGSTDFHLAAPLGLCRTYLLVHERTARGALEAIRAGRTVAQDADGVLRGAPEHVAAVRVFADASSGRGTPSRRDRLAALVALAALGLASRPPGRR